MKLGHIVAATLLASVVHAQEASWVGKRVIPRQPGLRIGQSDATGKPLAVAELTALAYTVRAEKDGFLQIEHRGRPGWVPKTDLLLPDAAIEVFSARVERDPRDTVALAFLGWAYKEKKVYTQARRCYDDVIRLGPTADWHNNRGVILLEFNEHEKALADFDEALRLAPKLDVALENRARTRAQLKKTDLALADWNEVLRRNPKNADAYVARGELLETKDQSEAALRDFGRAVELAPASALARLERGRLLIDLRRYDQATIDLAEALRLSKGNVEQHARAYFIRANLLTHQKQHNAALQDLAETLRLAPEYPGAQEARGWNRFLLGRFEDASQDFLDLIRAYPNDPSPYNCQAWLWATCPSDRFRDGKKALEYAQKAVALSEDKEPVFLDTLAAALAELGRFDEAIRTQQRVVKEAAQDPDLLAEAQARLVLYRLKRPYRQVIAK